MCAQPAAIISQALINFGIICILTDGNLSPAATSSNGSKTPVMKEVGVVSIQFSMLIGHQQRARRNKKMSRAAKGPWSSKSSILLRSPSRLLQVHRSRCCFRVFYLFIFPFDNDRFFSQSESDDDHSTGQDEAQSQSIVPRDDWDLLQALPPPERKYLFFAMKKQLDSVYWPRSACPVRFLSPLIERFGPVLLPYGSDAVEFTQKEYDVAYAALRLSVPHGASLIVSTMESDPAPLYTTRDELCRLLDTLSGANMKMYDISEILQRFDPSASQLWEDKVECVAVVGLDEVIRSGRTKFSFPWSGRPIVRSELERS